MPTETNRLILRGLGSTSPAVDLVPITPNDATDLSITARAIRCQTGGTLRITTREGVVRNTNIASGEVLTVLVDRVHATGTTATGLEAMI